MNCNLIIESILNDVLSYAIESEASDLHIEYLNHKKKMKISIRKLKKMNFYRDLNGESARSLLYLIQSKTFDVPVGKISEQFDSYFECEVKGQQLAARYSQVPLGMNRGVKVVLRFHNKKTFKLMDLGFSKDFSKKIRRSVKYNKGIILFSGSTNSGKSTSAHSLLESISCENKTVISIEDPVEKIIPNITQIQPTEEFDIPKVLRAILRQDPDYIYIGEIRDDLTLKLALRASNTGHLVISTIHASSLDGTLNRLLQLGAKEYELEENLLFLTHQKLIEKKDKLILNYSYRDFLEKEIL